VSGRQQIQEGEMKVGVGLPIREPHIDGAFMTDWARRADAGPFSSLAVTDRVVFYAKEPLIALAVAAGVTQRVGLMTTAIVVPTRETTLLARQCASIDALSNGRFTLGIGVAVRDEDYIATGYDFHRRGRRLDEQLPILRRIWAGEPADPDNKIGPIGPSPIAKGGPEVLIGGYVQAAVIRRTVTWGDGFLAPDGMAPDQISALIGQIDEAWSAAGRPGKPRYVHGGYYALGPNAEAQADEYTEVNYGFKPELAARMRKGIVTSPAAIKEMLQRREDAGIDEYIFRPCTEQLDAIDQLADVLGAIR
jgi:alkanesulfonate monooxygenase SsuD/methylene tetrahydromethanopterin reductase-like flavin-dependent oxidoreductase (luciferase family)